MPFNNTENKDHVSLLPIVIFGDGDVLITPAETPNKRMLVLSADKEKHPLGELHYGYKGKTIDQIPDTRMILMFKSVESIENLISSLNDLKETFTVINIQQ